MLNSLRNKLNEPLWDFVISDGYDEENDKRILRITRGHMVCFVIVVGLITSLFE
jgi:hypothetical protein